MRSGKAPLEEVRLAVTALARMTVPGVDGKLIEAYERNPDGDVQLAIVNALGRIATEETRGFLQGLAKGGPVGRWASRNKSLRQAARRSLDQVEKAVAAGEASR